MLMMFPEGSLFVALRERKGQKGELEITMSMLFSLCYI